MKPEIESLAQQLIAAATDVRMKVPLQFSTFYECDDLEGQADAHRDRERYEVAKKRLAELATPANITAVILGFREELKQVRRDALEEASQSIRDNFDLSQDEYASLVLSLGNRALVEKP